MEQHAQWPAVVLVIQILFKDKLRKKRFRTRCSNEETVRRYALKLKHLEDEEDLFRRSIKANKADQRPMKKAKSTTTEAFIDKETQIAQMPDAIGLPKKETDEAKRRKVESLWEGLELSLLRYVYLILKQHGLIENGQDFSQSWCGKNPNWFSYQTSKGRTFSLDAAINCLCELRQHIKYQTDAPQEYHKPIDELADLITQFLAVKYRVSALSERPK